MKPMKRAMESIEWMEQAACKNMDTDLFYPGKDEEIKTAIKACGKCAVREVCLEYALSNNITHGVWGGVSERDRRNIQRRRSFQRRTGT